MLLISSINNSKLATCAVRRASVIVQITEDQPRMAKRKRAVKSGGKRGDRRRKHRHWQVTVYYNDGEKFARVYIDRERAERFADRQKKSPVVKATRILEVDREGASS